MHRLAAFLIPFALTVPAFGVPTPVPESRVLATAELQQRCDGDDAGALDACNALIAEGRESGGDLAADYVRRGNLRFVRGDFADAAADYTHAIELAPDIGGTWFDRGTADVQLCKLDAAVADFTHALALVPASQEVLLARAQAYGQLKEYPPAANDLVHYLAKAPRDATALTLLGTIEDGTGRFDLAIAAYTRALTAKDDADDALFDRALAEAHARRFADGRADIDLYIAKRPGDAEGYAARASLFEKDAPDAAAADLAHAASLQQPARKSCRA